MTRTHPFVLGAAVIAFSICAGVVGLWLGRAVVNQIRNPAGGSQKQLLQVADKLNRDLPMMLDPHTRWDSAAALPGNKLMYRYTILSWPPNLEPASLEAAMRPSLVNNYKTSAQMAEFRRLNVALVYSYHDTKGNQTAHFEISPRDF